MEGEEAALLREVHLLCNGRVCVFARTLIPRSSLRGHCQRLARLGERPLGEVLFADPSMQREPFEIATLVRGHSLYRLALRGLECRPRAIWGRRTLFRIEERPLLVYEIFLPGIGPFPTAPPTNLTTSHKPQRKDDDAPADHPAPRREPAAGT